MRTDQLLRLFGAALLTLTSTSLIAPSAEAVTLDVCKSGCPCVPGQNENCFSSINEAIRDANANDTVLVQDGTYEEHIGFPVGFTGITVQSVNGPDSTTIDFKLTSSQTGGHVVSMGCSCGDCNQCPTVLDGFTITGGNSSSGPGGVEVGGGTINNCIIRNNRGRGAGGIRLSGGSSLTISNSTITGNTARSGAGITILANSGPTLIENTVITANTATRQFGGGISVSRNLTTIRDSMITGNHVDSDLGQGAGGGIHMSAADVTLEDSTVSGNTATGTAGGLGGGIFLSGTLSLENSPVSGNGAIGPTGLGGGIYCNGALFVVGSAVSGNTASTDGDEIFAAPGGNCLVMPRADLSIVKTGPSEMNVATQSAFTLTVTNNGPFNATGVTVSDELPPGLQFLEFSSSPECQPTEGGGVSCNIGDVAFGQSAEVTIVFVPVPAVGGKTLTNHASVTGAQFDQDSQNNDSMHDVHLLCRPPQVQRESISNFGRCTSTARKTPQWGRFGSRPVLEADSGEKLTVECGRGGILWFELLYSETASTGPDGMAVPPTRVGVCPFYGGCNEATVVHAGDNNGDGRPDCFVRTRWLSKDHSLNDAAPRARNSWTDELFETDYDWAETLFDAVTNNIRKISYKFDYAPPWSATFSQLPCPAVPDPKGPLRSATELPDPVIGPETEAFFDGVMDVLATIPVDGPMEEDTSLRCDFDLDGDCDDQDLAIFRMALGTCLGDGGFNPEADDDASGCVDSEDEEFLFSDTDGDGVPDEADNCQRVENADQADTDADRIGNACDYCRNVANGGGIAPGHVGSARQTDDDGDGIGNECDTDFDQSGFTNVTDLLWFLDAFGLAVVAGTCPDPGGNPVGPCAVYDLTAEGSVVNVSDLLVMISPEFFGTPTLQHGCAPDDGGIVRCPLP
jgi:uncharacterized repeat protein (TIGR01451 family)